MRPPHSIPAFQLKKKNRLNYRPDFEVTRPNVNPEMDAQMYQMKEDVRAPNHRIGMNINPNLIAIPCITIAERNGVVLMGKGIGFDKTEVRTQPLNWDNKLSFVSERFGTTADFSQKEHLAINSYIR